VARHVLTRGVIRMGGQVLEKLSRSLGVLSQDARQEEIIRGE
jgi:hypothetical protein